MSRVLAAFIEQRFKELDAKEAEIRAVLQDLESERACLRRARKAAGFAPDTMIAAEAATILQRARAERYETTIPGAALAVVRESKMPLRASEIAARLSARLGVSVSRKQVSPTLSRLKRNGKLARSGAGYVIPIR